MCRPFSTASAVSSALILVWTGKAIGKSGEAQRNLWLLTCRWGLKQVVYPRAQEILLSLHFLRYGKEREVLLQPRDLEGVPEILADKIEKIETDQDFHPTPGSFYGMCGITAHWPVMAQALVPVEITAPATKEDAEKAASLLLSLSRWKRTSHRA